jgi:hypothetical protein
MFTHHVGQRATMNPLSNEFLYLAYIAVLVAGVAIAEVRHCARRISGRAGPPRTEADMSVMHAEFIVITGINLGIGQITFQYMPEYIQKLAFLLVMIETFAWAFLIYRDDWFSRKLIRLMGASFR